MTLSDFEGISQPRMQIKGKVALVTGSAIRIGRVIAEALLRKGARVAVHYHRSEKEARSSFDKLRTSGQVALFKADLEKPSEIHRLIRAVEKKMGPIDILINNAAIFEKNPFFRLTEKEWNRHLDINLKAPFLLSQAAAKKMMKRKRGCIINLADRAVKHPYKNYAAYLVSKGGLLTLTKVLDKELSPHVRAMAIPLGAVLPSKGWPRRRLKKWGTPQSVAKKVLSLIEKTSTK